MASIYTSKHTAEKIDEAVERYDALTESIYNIVCDSIRMVSSYSTSSIDSPEWSEVILDADDKVLAGINEHGKVFVFIVGLV